MGSASNHQTETIKSSSSSFVPVFPYREAIEDDETLLRLSSEFSRLKAPIRLLQVINKILNFPDNCYLDHAGASLYTASQLTASTLELQENLFSNPHSRNPSSTLTTDAIDNVRQRILRHFNTSEDDYTVIFTSGATGSLKILGECFPFGPQGLFAYLEDNHTSVLGIREYVEGSGRNNEVSPLEPSQLVDPTGNRKVYCISKKEMELMMRPGWNVNEEQSERVLDPPAPTTTPALFAYPAQCNFSGYKYPLEWIQRVREGALDKMLRSFNEGERISSSCIKRFWIAYLGDARRPPWCILLDAASFIPTSPLDLSTTTPDFICLSFYKIFGFPTGLGALLVRKGAEWGLGGKKYFGGGTVSISIPSLPFHVKRGGLAERFEDGSLPFLSILALNHGFDALSTFFPKNTMEGVRTRTFRLAQYFYKNLRSLKYKNGREVAVIYADSSYDSELVQGAIISFNLLREEDGSVIGYSEMEQLGSLHKIHLRYGCFCNPGACRRHLHLTTEQLLEHFQAGHVCGDGHDLVNGRPTGAIRVSFGYMSEVTNADTLLQLIHSTWVKGGGERPLPPPPTISKEKMEEKVKSHMEKRTTLSRIFVYPVKSCGGFEVRSSWPLSPQGLLHDREWLIVSPNGVPLTTKREPRLFQISPRIDLEAQTLYLSYPGVTPDLTVSLKEPSSASTIPSLLCSSKVCGDSVSGFDCGEEASNWLSTLLGRKVRLLRKSPNHPRKQKARGQEISLANQSQFLLLSMPSLRRLGAELRHGGGPHFSNYEDGPEGIVENLIGRFRGNFVIESNVLREYEEEEGWDGIIIGGNRMKSGGPCVRCATICVDPKTSVKSSEPYLTLSRGKGGRPTFGLHLYNDEDEGTTPTEKRRWVSIGDLCQVNNKNENNNNNNGNTSRLRNEMDLIQSID